MYYIITKGKFPFDARVPLELYVKVTENPPTQPTKYNKRLSSEFENIVLTLLNKQPFERSINYDELKNAILKTPLYLSPREKIAKVKKIKHRVKKCIFRFLNNEKTDVEKFVKAGGRIDGFVYPANFLLMYQKSLAVFQGMGMPYFFDPATYRLPYSSYAQTKGLVELPYVIDKNNVLTVDDLKSLKAQKSYVKKCIDWQLQWGVHYLVAPFHFARNLSSDWIDIDIKLMEETILYVRSKQLHIPIYGGLCFNIESYTSSSNRLALLNRYSRARVAGYLFYIDCINERTTNPIQLNATKEILHLFQSLDVPVIACRVGTLGLGLLCSGVDGMTTGIASLTSFSENTLLANRAQGYDMTKKYYIPEMMLTIPVPLAEDILAESANAYLRCNCSHCKGSYANLARIAKPHFLDVRSQEITTINKLATPSEQQKWFIGRVEKAIKICDNIRKQGIVLLKAGYYSHLKVWLQVF